MLVKVFEGILKNKWLLSLIIIINLGGFLFGIHYYWSQLMKTPFYLWPLVMDSPIAVLLIALAFIFYLLKRKNEYLNALAFFGCLKYGIWSMVVILLYYSFYFQTPFYSSFLFFSHFGMILEALMLLGISSGDRRPLLFATSWFFLNDFLDYTIGIHPYLPSNQFIQIAALTAFLTTFLSVLLYSKLTS